MKKKSFFVAAMAAGLLIWTGCTDKVQSELNMDDVQEKAGTATIQGIVTYNAGTTDESGTIVTSNVKPAASVQVLVSVDYASYGDGSEGKKQFTATTDASGNYSIQLPVGSKPIPAANVEVDVLPFTADFAKEVNGVIKPIDNAVFTEVAYLVGAKNLPLENGKVEICNMQVSTLADLDPNGRSQKFTVQGTIYAQGEKKIDNEKPVSGAMANAIKISTQKVTVVLTNTNASLDDSRELKYTTTSANETGFYSQEVTFFDNWDYSDVKVTVTAEAFYVTASEAEAGSGKGYIHYYYTSDATDSWKSQELPGLFKASEANNMASSINSIVALTIDVAPMVFQPENKDNIRGIGLLDKGDDTNYYKSSNPYGW